MLKSLEISKVPAWQKASKKYFPKARTCQTLTFPPCRLREQDTPAWFVEIRSIPLILFRAKPIGTNNYAHECGVFQYHSIKSIIRIFPRDHLCNSQNRNICLFLFFSSFSHQLAVLSCEHALQSQMPHLQNEAFCLSITKLCA